MKKRKGFVANSSTTSFFIYGAEIHDSDLEDITVRDMREDLWKLQRDLGIKTHIYTADDNYTYYIGVSYLEIDDEETGAQFKKRCTEEIEKTIAIMGGKLKQPLTYEQITETVPD